MQASDSKAAEEFIRGVIDSIPHLEGLLLVWTMRPRSWSAGEIAEKLYIDEGRARDVVGGLVRRGLLVPDEAAETAGERFRYAVRSEEQDKLMESVERLYKSDLIRITRMIHSKAAPAVQEFAQAFRLKKE